MTTRREVETYKVKQNAFLCVKETDIYFSIQYNVGLKGVRIPGRRDSDFQNVLLFFQGLLYQVGDIVCTCDLDGLTYFAQIRGFLQDNFCEKFVVVTWLVPTRPNQHTFDPLLFLPGQFPILIFTNLYHLKQNKYG